MNGWKRAVYHLCRVILGGVFLYAGLLKSQDITAFAGQIAAYQLLPYQVNYLLAATLPYVEVLAGGLLLANRHVRPAALLLGGMTLVFVGALASVILRGLSIDCGCFGPHDRSTPEQALVRDLALLALAHVTFHLRNRFVPKTRA